MKKLNKNNYLLLFILQETLTVNNLKHQVQNAVRRDRVKLVTTDWEIYMR